jgi:hypothetical protein
MLKATHDKPTCRCTRFLGNNVQKGDRMSSGARGVLLCVLICAISAGAVVREEPYDWYLTNRILYGLKMNVSPNVTIQVWNAQCWGAQYFPNRFNFDPFLYTGWDIVPGFNARLFTLFDNASVFLGGDIYMLKRLEHTGDSIDPGQPKTIFRPRANLTLGKPIGTRGASLTWTHRFERLMQRQWKSGPDVWLLLQSFRYRSTLKLSAPSFTALKISPYTYYEAFTPSVLNYFYAFQWELGVSFQPIKGLSVSLADNIDISPDRPGWTIHELNLYVFYTIDVAKPLQAAIEAIRSKNYY